MASRLRSRRPAIAAATLAAGLMLTIAGCAGHLTPLGPYQSPAPMPLPRHLGSPLIVQVMRSQPVPPAGTCPAGWATAPAPPGGALLPCFHPAGTPVTITSASVSPVAQQPPPPPGHPAGPTQYGFKVGVPSADVAAVTAAIRQAYNSRDALGISAAGRIWQAPQVAGPFAGQQLYIALPSMNLARQLYRILVPAS